jgi:hypothetical protein
VGSRPTGAIIDPQEVNKPRRFSMKELPEETTKNADSRKIGHAVHLVDGFVGAFSDRYPPTEDYPGMGDLFHEHTPPEVVAVVKEAVMAAGHYLVREFNKGL